MNNGIHRRITFTFVAALIALTCLVLLCGWLSRQGKHYSSLVRHTHDILQKVQETRLSLVNAESSVRGYLLTNRHDFMETQWESRVHTKMNLDVLQGLTEDNSSQQANLRALRRAVAERESIWDAALAKYHADAPLAVRKAALPSTRARAAAQNTKNLFDAIYREETVLFNQRGQQLQKVNRRFGLVIIGLVLLLYVALIGIYKAARRDAVLLHETIRLRQEAMTDGLTGLNNHRAFQERLAEEFGRSVRYNKPLSLLLLDVDHFKAFNDTFGHFSGDQVLRRVGQLLRRSARGSDFVARYGGEEFVVILPETDVDGAMEVAERIRATIAGDTWDLRAVTVSVGCADVRIDTEQPSALIEAADTALYDSKRSGRNRVTQYTALLPVSV